MRRLTNINVNTPDYHDKNWREEFHTQNNHRYDHVRLQWLLRHVKPGDKVIDLGAGLFGACQYAVDQLKDLYLGTEFRCLDYSATARDIALRDFPALKYDLGDVLPKTSYPDQIFDVVIASELIEHMDDPEALVKEMARICKPGGWMMLSTVDPDCEDAKRYNRSYPEHVWQFTPEDLLELFKPYGKCGYERVGNYDCVECQTYA